MILTAVRGFNPLPSPHPLLQVLREDEFGPGLVGGKSANLAALRSKLPQGCALRACSPLLGALPGGGGRWQRASAAIMQIVQARCCHFRSINLSAPCMPMSVDAGFRPPPRLPCPLAPLSECWLQTATGRWRRQWRQRSGRR